MQSRYGMCGSVLQGAVFTLMGFRSLMDFGARRWTRAMGAPWRMGVRAAAARTTDWVR
jgi:hypothetical protein